MQVITNSVCLMNNVAVVSAVRDEVQTILCMIDAPAGTSKTFTERVIAARLLSENKLVVIVASTGIAALQ